jgi:hypothetical protein
MVCEPFFESFSHRPVTSSLPVQHPGSPGWPQQELMVTIFFALFLKKSHSFFHKGMGARRLLKNAFGSGRLCE